MELWDGYDIDFNKLEGVTLVRGDTRPEGVFHLVCEVAVRHRDGQYLLMRRDPKKIHGAMWELTAGGSAIQGETPVQCAARELKEETGIVCDSLQELGRVTHVDRRSIYVDFLGITDCEKDAIRLQEGETVAYQWVDPKDIPGTPDLVTRRMLLFLKDLS